jgi:hypothetical protein
MAMAGRSPQTPLPGDREKDLRRKDSYRRKSQRRGDRRPRKRQEMIVREKKITEEAKEAATKMISAAKKRKAWSHHRI